MDLPNEDLLPKPPHSLSIVIPVFNEEAALPALFARLYPALDALGIPYECVFIDDGSRDRSVAVLRAQHAARPAETRVVILAAQLRSARGNPRRLRARAGDAVITLDADLQNPPEEIPRLVEALRAGHDYVGTIRRGRQDHWARRCLVARSSTRSATARRTSA